MEDTLLTISFKMIIWTPMIVVESYVLTIHKDSSFRLKFWKDHAVAGRNVEIYSSLQDKN